MTRTKYIERRLFAIRHIIPEGPIVCNHCGRELDPTERDRQIQFDHIDPSTKEYNINPLLQDTSSIYTETMLLNELKKCQILCWPCHLKKSATENRGETSGMSIYSENRITDIVNDLKHSDLTLRSIAHKYHMPLVSVTNINLGKVWAWFTGASNHSPVREIKHIEHYLTENEVLEIVQLLKTTNMSYIEIAKKYGVKDHIIHFINSGRTWSHLTGLSDENRARPKIRENISKSSIEQIILLYQLTGLGCTSIGKQLNIQPDTAYYHINRYKKNASTQFAYPMNTLGQYVFSDEDTWIGPDLDHPGFYKEYKD